MKPQKILRPKASYEKLACGKTKFDEDYRYHSPDNSFVPGTDIPRLKPIPLGERNIGYLEHEVDALIAALAKLRDAGARTAQGFLADAQRKPAGQGAAKR